ncbi:replication-associated recombination protein A [[Mannheimia] succiniciproducens]|nr:replication-associated recombination protein A [[Mannheimia] succiniciproducens]
MKQTSLFSQNNTQNQPLASRLRPTSLDEFVGQKHLLEPGKVLQQMIVQDELSSMIFWGPSGVGKTTLAQIIAHQTNAKFITFSAVVSGIKDIKKIMEEAETDREMGEKTIVFIDEIHRFNKAQQDAFLPYVEKGSIILIGATTENPSFEINSALLSRCKVFVLEALSNNDIVLLLKQALNHPQAFIPLEVNADEKLLQAIAEFANGDARIALNTLELAVKNVEKQGNSVHLSENLLADILNNRQIVYDKTGEEHYNIISALHKAMRNSDPDAAIYWLSRMLEGGEDPVYIARRLIRFAGEDIGLADTNALTLTTNVFQACRFIGMPECDVHLTEAVVYLSLAPKSNAIYQARCKVREDVKNTRNDPVPLHLRNAPTKLMKNLGYGKGYKLAHHYEDKLTTMQTMPDNLLGKQYYFPTEEGNEQRFKARLAQIKQWKAEHK